jgi:uncharacterized protein (DUF2147 family)
VLPPRALAGALLSLSFLTALTPFASCLAADVAAEAAAAAKAAPAEVGLWETISDKDGKPEGYIRIRLVGDELRGVIERGMPGDDPNDICTKCPGDRKNQRMLGLTIITGLHRQGDHWAGGEILDPKSGSLYRCRIRAIDSGRKLELRGFIGISLLGRTQTWLRAE